MIKVKLPDGSTASFPDGTPPDVMKAAIQKKFPPQNAPQAAAPGPAAAAPGGAPPAAPTPEVNDAGIPGIMGDVVSGLNALGDTASFGLAPAAMRGIQNLISPGSGDETAAKVAAVNEAHPAGVVAGTLAAIPVDMALAAPLAAAAPAVPALNAALKGGGLVGTAARLATVGSATGALTAATHGGDVGTGAVVGGVLGPVAGAVAYPFAKAAERLITPAATNAWRYLAKKLDVAPDELVAHITQYVRQTGQQPSLAQIVSDRGAGVIGKFGADFTEAGQVLRSAAQAADQALPAQAQGVIKDAAKYLPAAPRSIAHLNPATTSQAEILNATTAATTAAMNPIRDTVVHFAPDLATDIGRALGTGRAVRALRTRLMDGQATVGDADLIRRRLDKLAGGAIPNPDIQDIADEVEQVVGKQVTEYARIMGEHANAKRYAAGFGHGASGAERGAATDPGLRAALATDPGESGFRAGSLSRTAAAAGGTPSQAAGVLGDIARPGTAQTAFNSTVTPPAARQAQEAATALRTAGERSRATAPGSLQPQPDSSAAAANIAASASLAGVAPISAAKSLTRGLIQAMQGIPHLTPAVQREIATALSSTNAAIRDAAIMQLRRAGVSAGRIRIIQGLAAAHGAKSTTSYDPVSSGVAVNASGG